MHERGVVTSEPGLYFVGLIFQYSAASNVIPGVARDARYVVERLVARDRRRRGRRGARGRLSACTSIEVDIHVMST